MMAQSPRFKRRVENVRDTQLALTIDSAGIANVDLILLGDSLALVPSFAER